MCKCIFENKVLLGHPSEETNIFLHFDMKFGSYGFIDIRKKKFQPPPLLKGGGEELSKLEQKGGIELFL